MLSNFKRAPELDKSTIAHFTNLRPSIWIFPSKDIRRLSERRRSMPVGLDD